MHFNKYLLSWMSATYGVIIYSIAFGISMWLIVGQDDLINNSVFIVGFVLSAIYLISVIISVILMLGLIIHSIVCITGWLIVMSLIFLPECGLVLFMSLYKWGIDSRNGQIELWFYLTRGIFNVVFIVCVQSLVSEWKSEKEISRYSTNLCGYKNPTTNSSHLSHQNEDMSTTINPVFKYTTISNMEYMPTTEFDPRDLHEIMRRSESPVITYTTQSLDRKLKSKQKLSLRDELILRPLTHRPFEYLEHNSSSSLMINNLVDDQVFHRRHYYDNNPQQNQLVDRNSSTHSIRDVAL